MFILMAVLQVCIIVSLNEAYTFICPSQAHWHIRAKSKCNPLRNYTCLLNVTFQVNEYSDRCRRPRLLASGFKYVFQPNLNNANCSSNRYQPYVFDTDGHTNCAFQKSHCNSLGQVTYEHSNTLNDRKCMCNMERGYTLVSNTKNQSYCIPSTDDCSCHLGIISYNKTISWRDLKVYGQTKIKKVPPQGDMLNITQNLKIDNYNYNLKFPTNVYRNRAFIAVLVLMVVYSFLGVTLQRISPRIFQLLSTPRKFRIVKCTDCSITVEWYTCLTDDYITYELNHRLQGWDDWNVVSLEEVLKDINGRRTCKVQDLLPETCCELKICSVNSHVKSYFSEIKTVHTLKRAPRDFRIVESSDRSITVEWYIIIPDDFLEYELNHRLQGGDDWDVVILSFEDEFAEIDGRRTCTVQDLLPETCYELKICSVNNHVKSHFSETETMHTQRRVLPKTRYQLAEEDKIRYNNLMKSSETEKMYFIKIMLVGKESAGKTCLWRRLLKESLSNIPSKEETDIGVRRCKISIEDGEWTMDEEFKKEKVNRTQKGYIPNGITKNEATEDTFKKMYSTQSMQSRNGETNALVNHFLPVIKTTDECVKDRDIRNTSHRGELSSYKNDASTDSMVNLDTNEAKDEFSSFVMPDDLMSNVFSKSTVNTHSTVYALFELWDFPGQKDFYATYQAFLNSSALYLVVADMSEDISEQGFIDFWFDSIHCQRTVDVQDRDGCLYPPILLIFTGKDKYDQAAFEKRKKELNEQMDNVLGYQSRYHHLHNSIFLSNKADTQEEFDKLRSSIVKTGMKMDDWGKDFPLKWIRLELLMEINMEHGKDFITLSDMYKLAKHCDINIIEKEEILMFLKYQHNVGNIIFFENIPDLIILKPQWLADVLRCFFSDRVDNSRFYHLEDWTLFIRQGQISEYLITKLLESNHESQVLGKINNLHRIMEKLDILVKIDNSGYYLMPSKMPPAVFADVCKDIGILTEDCNRTSWLCFKFEFLPRSFFYHLSAWLISKYLHGKSNIDRTSVALYRDCCMFDIDGSGCEKILVAMSTDTIALQVVSFSKQQMEVGKPCSDIFNKVKQVVEEIKGRFKVKLSFQLHFKCSDGEYCKDTFAYDTLTRYPQLFCKEHKTTHRSETIYMSWMKNEVKRSLRNREDMSTNEDHILSKVVPSKEEKFAQAQTPVKYDLPVSVTLRKRISSKEKEPLNINSCTKLLGKLVFADSRNKQIIICNSDGTDFNKISLSYIPCYITEIDSDTVAVSCTLDRTILIINISTGDYISSIKSSEYCHGLSYNDNKLYVIIEWERINVMDLTGNLIRIIPLPNPRIVDITVHGERLICIDFTSIYCCQLDGRVIWKFKNEKYEHLRRVATDNKGEVYVTNDDTKSVVIVFNEGKRYKEIITKSDGLDEPCGLYVDRKENILLVCNKSNGKVFLFDVKHTLV